jgi:amino acid transporter
MAKGSNKSLSKGRLGVVRIVFFVVAASAPLVGMTGAVPVAMLLGNGAATPGAYLAVGLTLLVFSVGYAAMSSKVTNAGAFFAFVGKGLGPKAGVASAYASIIGYVTIQLAIYGFFGLVISLTAAGFGLNLPWWAWALIAWVVVTLLSLLSVDIGAKVLGVLLSVELLALIITAVAILVNGGPEPMDINASFNPALVFAGGFAGTAGIALAFAFASFIGFEATAIYGEESKDPKRDVPRATYWAIGIIAALFAVVSFAMVVGMGSTQLIDQVIERSTGLADPAAVLFSLAAEYVSPEIVTIMALLVVTSLFAGLLAFQNAAARYFFAMGRGGVMPSMLGETNKVGAPQNGALLTSIIAGAVIVLFAAAGLDPFLNLFSWMSGIAVIAVVAVEVLVSIAVIAYFNKAGGGTLWNSKIAPAASVVLMLAGLYLLMSRFNLLAGTSADGVDPSLPESAWALSGLGWFFVLLPFLAMIVGYVVAGTRKNKNDALVRDFAS